MNSPKKSLGQHFLKNQTAIAATVNALKIAPGETVIEIGPGHGELTKHLLATGAEKVIAIEKDWDLHAELPNTLKAESYKLEAVLGDALKLLPEIVAGLGDAPYSIAGNIPYYITGHLLRIIGELGHKPLRTVLMIQKEVAKRVSAEPPKMNRLAAMTQIWARTEIVMHLAPADFDPAPTVDSAIILLETLPDAPRGDALARYFHMAHILFQQPRKTAMNNLTDGLSLSKEAAIEQLKPLGLLGAERPGNLSVATIFAISNLF